MKATYDSNGVVYNREQIKNGDVETLVENLDAWNNPYLIIENDKGDYMQCMGGHDGFVVEARFQGDGKFKHFVIGHKEMSKVWHELTGTVGPVRVLGHEVLQRSDAEKLLKFFLATSEVEISYNKRNITKMLCRLNGSIPNRRIDLSHLLLRSRADRSEELNSFDLLGTFPGQRWKAK